MRHSLKSPALLPLTMLGVNPYIAITANIKLHEYGDKACTVRLKRNKISKNINVCIIKEPFNNTLMSYRTQVLQLCSVNKMEITNNRSLIDGHIS